MRGMVCFEEYRGLKLRFVLKVYYFVFVREVGRRGRCFLLVWINGLALVFDLLVFGLFFFCLCSYRKELLVFVSDFRFNI